MGPSMEELEVGNVAESDGVNEVQDGSEGHAVQDVQGEYVNTEENENTKNQAQHGASLPETIRDVEDEI